VGAVLGDTDYVRDREAEFGDRGVPREELIRRVRRCQATIRRTLEEMPDPVLLATYPATLPASLAASLGGDGSAVAFLTHLTWHLGWHLGQVDYHRRLLVGGESV